MQLITLNPQNTIFVIKYLVYIIIENILVSIMQLKFENHLSMKMTPMANFDRS